MSGKIEKFEALAIAYLTGQASPEQVAEYRRLFANDEAFKAVVRRVELWLAPLNEDIADKPAPEGLFDSIMSEIEKDTSAPVAQNTLPDAVNDNSVGRWKAMTAAASFIAMLAIGSHFIGADDPVPSPSETQQLMALLADETQPKLVAIVYNPDTGRVVARMSNITVPEGSDLQLWLIRDGAAAPVSLGILDSARDSKQIEFSIPEALKGGTDTLAVSLEDLGGSKSAGPEGPVLFTGKLSEIAQKT